MHNSMQLWWKGATTQFGDFQKFYDVDLWTMERKDGSWASVVMDGKQIASYRGDGAWNLARKEAEMHMIKRDQLQQEGWVTN